MIEATNQIGAGKKIVDRRGDVWEYANYNSPSGPAFWITLPERYWPAGTGNYTIHFDGVMGVAGEESAESRGGQRSTGEIAPDSPVHVRVPAATMTAAQQQDSRRIARGRSDPEASALAQASA